MAYAFDVIVIGGGAAGMFAAGKCAEYGKSVLVIERNASLGKKLRITGKGRCNVTNCCAPEEVLENVINGKKFLMSAVHKFTPWDTMAFFEDLGVPLKVERGNRVFPQSDSAPDIVNALRKYMAGGGVKMLQDRVVSIAVSGGSVRGVVTESGRKFAAESVIVATGGKSYPVTGSTGDGYKIAMKLGHKVTEIKPSLVPINTAAPWIKKLQGLSLKNVVLDIFDGDKKIFTEMGEMLFTHFGVSGPLVLSASCHMDGLPDKKYKMSVDLKPALDEKKLDQRILRDFEKNANKDFINSLSELLPSKLIPVVVELSGINPRAKTNQITKDERKNLCSVLKKLEFTADSMRPVNEAIITAGGIDTSEINPSTMESRIVSGLYFAGEVVDIHAYTGGFNLQIAFSTAALAAENIKKR
ncbi:MAG: NAD(P)/FAD-dependent oxidoreductase [Clostridia bacterium]|nr:NAD(P)/FAD-dependent oxidoreductase [Clostridia bacterium]